MTLSLSGHAYRRPLSPLAVLALAAVAAAGCNDSINPTPQPDSSIRFIADRIPVALTPDGTTAVLEDLGGADRPIFFYDVSTGVYSFQAGVGTHYSDIANAVSANLRVAAIFDTSGQAGFWAPTNGWTAIGTNLGAGCEGAGTGGAFDISDDGKVVVGGLWQLCENMRSFKWSDSSGTGQFIPLVQLGENFPGTTSPPDNRATVISGDGRIAAGYAHTALVDRWPAVWRQNGTGFLLPATAIFTTDWPGEIKAINSDGTMMAGTWNLHGFYWTAASGSVDFGGFVTDPIDALDGTFPEAIAANSRLIFGRSGQLAFVWSLAGGLQKVQDLVKAAGVYIPDGWVLTGVHAASTDGTVLMGDALDPMGKPFTYILRVPVSAFGL